MSATSFLIAHGEKLLVAVIAGVCGLVLWNTFTDQSFRPVDNLQRVEEINRSIDEVFKTQQPPTLKAPRPYLDQLLARVGEQPPVAPTMPWLTALPDVNKEPPGVAYVYIYELLAPSVRLKSTVGQLQISLALPVSESEGPGRRVSSAAERTWSRQDQVVINNHAKHVGIQVQIKVGNGEWQPLDLPGASKEGVLPLTGPTTEPIVRKAFEDWQTHSVRARIIATATALDFASTVERPLNTVVVFPGRISNGPTDDDRAISLLTIQIRDKKGPLLEQALRPVDGPLPPNVRAGGERVFLGPWSEVGPESTVTVTGNVRCALIGITSEPLKDDAAKTREVGKFVILRLFQQGTEQKWMEKPVELKYGVGDRLGLCEPKMIVPSPFTKKPIEADLSTPFVLQSLLKDQKRVLYWTIKPKARQGGGRERDLEVGKKEVPTDVVELTNPETGNKEVWTKLITVPPPPTNVSAIYPYRSAVQNEKDDFIKAPSTFIQWELTPKAPKPHQPGTGPLEALHQAKVKEGALDAASYTTDTTYYELGDQRLVWWDVITHSVMKDDPKGIEKTAGTTPDAPPTAAPVQDAPPPEPAHADPPVQPPKR